MKNPVLIILSSIVLLMASFTYPPTVQSERDNHLAMGNPTNAVHDQTHNLNYLIIRNEYALSYNTQLAYPNWVSWHLSSAWMGETKRCEGDKCFTSDTSLPFGYIRIRGTDYVGSGFDRGHLCPSADRTKTRSENDATFFMTNMFPQAPNLNQQTWRLLEDYCQNKLVPGGNECYIIAGGSGTGGTGKNGAKDKIAGGNVNVPETCWKIIVVIPEGTNDLSRINQDTRVIAVLMPNNQLIDTKNWGKYRVTVDSLETVTGFDFLSNIPIGVQNLLEAQRDSGPTK